MVTIHNTGFKRARKLIDNKVKPIEKTTLKDLRQALTKLREQTQANLLEIAFLQRTNEIQKAKIKILMNKSRQHSFRHMKIGTKYKSYNKTIQL